MSPGLRDRVHPARRRRRLERRELEEVRSGGLPPFVRRLSDGPIDVVVARLDGERTRWRRVLVPVSRAGDVANAMIGVRPTVGVSRHRPRARPPPGRVDARDPRRGFEGSFETRVSSASIEAFLGRNAGGYDLVVVGSSSERSAASRFISAPTFLRLDDLGCDLAIVHRGTA